MAVAVSGRGSNLEALCEALAGDPTVAVVLVVSERAAPALELAVERGIATHQWADHTDADEWLRTLGGADVDLLVLAGYLKLVPTGVTTALAGRIINVHPALLPKHGGPGMYGQRVHAAVLAAGDTETGATVHLVDAEYDRGTILAQGKAPVLPDDTPASLATRVLTVEHQLLPAAVRSAAVAGHPVPFDFT